MFVLSHRRARHVFYACKVSLFPGSKSERYRARSASAGTPFFLFCFTEQNLNNRRFICHGTISSTRSSPLASHQPLLCSVTRSHYHLEAAQRRMIRCIASLCPAAVFLTPLSTAASRTFASMSATNVWASTPPIPSDKRPIVLSGPSGVGKSTLLKKLFEEYPNDFGFSVSRKCGFSTLTCLAPQFLYCTDSVRLRCIAEIDTTRDPRPGEVRGQSYHYVSHDEFESLVQQGAFLEHAQFGGNRYGTTAKAVADVSTEGITGADGSTNARRAVLDIDAQGVKLIKANHASLNPIYIFISPPSFATLKKRLIGRGTETHESVTKRLKMAAKEMAFARQKGAHDWIIVNDDLDKAYGLLKKAINETLKQGEDDTMPEQDEEEREWTQQA